MSSRKFRLLPWSLLCLCVNANAQFEELVAGAVESQGDKVCAKLAPMPVDSCKSILSSAGKALTGSSIDDVKETLKEELTKPDFLNSAIAKAFGGSVPLGLEFKALDGENEDTVLGLTYAVTYEHELTDVSENSHWNRHYSVAFKATGTVTENSNENPRNFLETKLTGFGILSTRIPQQSDEFGEKLQAYAIANSKCEDNPDEQTCQEATEKGFAMLDSTTEFLKSFQYYKFGLDAGFESDQEFDAKQSTISAFVYGQYESWGSQSILDILNVSPAVRLGIDSVDPDEETPRAMAGDSSSFTRFSGEASLWIPLGTRLPLSLTFNYRYYKELDASSIVKNASLDSYILRTYSLTGTNGLFASYSSGRLPLDVQSNNVVAIGWKTYF